MQILPSNITDVTEAAASSAAKVEEKASGFAETFASLLEGFGKMEGSGKVSSFITAGRTRYSGVPEGFAGFDEAAGTLGADTLTRFKTALAKRNINEASLDSLNQLMASGAPMTVSRVFSTLAGEARASAGLEGTERANFSQLMQKVGFTQEEAGALLDLSDRGKSAALLKGLNSRLSQFAGELKDGVEVHAEEFLALIQGLDLTENTKGKLMQLFGNEGSKLMTAESLQALLAEAGTEIANKALAAGAVKSQMRDALDEAMQAAKLARRTEIVADTRGSRYLQQSEALMRETIAKKIDQSGNSLTSALDDREENILFRKTGKSAAAKAVAAQDNSEPGQDRAGAGKSRNAENEAGSSDEKEAFSPKNRAERILNNTVGSKAEETNKAGNDARTALENMAQRLTVADAPAQPLTVNVPGNAGALAGMASAYRQEIFTQVENGLLQNLAPGHQRLTLQLAPEELGQVTVILTVHRNEIKASIRADSQESAAALGEQLESLRASLEEQGLKVAELDVQCQMQDNPAADLWNGEGNHNFMRDSQEQDRMVRLNRLRRNEGEIPAPTPQQHAPALSQAGLHIIA